MESIINYLEALALVIPVPLFAFIGGLIEEILAPIPSPVIMMLAGGIISSQKGGAILFLLTALVSALSKTLGCWLWYIVGDKGEDIAVDKFGKYVGIRHKDLEGVGKHFKNTEKDFYIIAIARSLPIAPTTPISIIAGLFKLDLKKYLAASFTGNLIRNSLFLYMGYVGKESFEAVVKGLDSIESIVQILIGLALVGFFGYLFIKRSKTDDPISTFLGKFLKK